MPTDEELIQALQEAEPNLTLLPHAYPNGQTVEVRFAYGGRIVLDGYTAEAARMTAAFHRVLARELDRAAAQVEAVVANGCEGSA